MTRFALIRLFLAAVLGGLAMVVADLAHDHSITLFSALQNLALGFFIGTAAWSLSAQPGPGRSSLHPLVGSRAAGLDEFSAFLELRRTVLPRLPTAELAARGDRRRPGLLHWLRRQTRHEPPWDDIELRAVLMVSLGEPHAGRELPLLSRIILALLAKATTEDAAGYEELRDFVAVQCADLLPGTAAADAETRLLGRLDAVQSADPAMAAALQEAMAAHAYPVTVAMRLLERARLQRRIGTADFSWLRWVDRPLFIALNALGVPKVQAEALAAVSHYGAERQAGTALAEPHIAAAMFAIQTELALPADTEACVPVGPASGR